MTQAQRLLLYVGTYTRPAPYLKTYSGQGIYLYSLDRVTGALTPVSETHGIDSPSYLAISRDQQRLYAVSEVWLWPEGTITAYAIDQQTGALTYINRQSTRGTVTAYASVDQADHFAFAANYWDGETVAVFPLRADGGVLPASDSVRHLGRGPKPAQDKSHGHCIVTDPTNRWVHVVDLGLDQVVTYQLDHQYGRLIPHGTTQLEAGMGARHMVFHPNGQSAYVIGEWNSTITALIVNAETGGLMPLHSVPTLPEGVSAETSYGSDIQIHPSGKFLYGGNRGHDSLVICAVEEGTGRLTVIGHQSTGGNFPRNFVIDPTGMYLLVGNQNSDTIVSFRIDQQTGLLEPTGQVANVPAPVCLKFVTLG
ncbi:MAG: lactonase family protein [Chloroflexi bacterium]|uniref:lactonase family protein n=1 Tax=Candidatus Flexifilum breve TaxID=3140694 RepID=UPI0031367100|nr:lactonase family protein [Chloroflexota bacterium]